MRRGCCFIRSGQGSVSVYMISAAAAVFLFMSVLIDYARIYAFEKMTETAAYAGVRSVLSAYDDSLYARYGLFGRGGTESDGIFQRAVGGSLSAASGFGSGSELELELELELESESKSKSESESESDEAFRLLDPRVEDARVNAGAPLGRHDVLRRQIMEEMKYKAPVDFAMELAAKFRPLSGAMKEASRTVNLLEELRALYDQRQARLLAAAAYQKDASNAVSSSGLNGLIPAGRSASAPAGEGTAFAVAGGFGSYREWIQADAARADGEEPANDRAIADYAQSARAAAAAIRRSAGTAAASHSRLLRLAAQELEAAEALNRRMETAVRQAESAGNATGFDRLGGSRSVGAEGGGGGPGAQESDMADVRSGAGKLLLQKDWFAGYRSELEDQGAALAALDAEAGSFQSAVSTALLSPDLGSGVMLQEGAASLAAAYANYESIYLSPGGRIQEREKMIRSGQEADKRLQALDKQADAKWGEARKLLQQISLLPQGGEAADGFRKLGELSDRNGRWNEAAAGSEQGTGEEEPDKSERLPEASDSMNEAEGMFGGMADMLDGVRDELYVNEYAVHRFVPFDPRKLRYMAAGPAETAGSAGIEAAHALTVHNQETEYIVYGRDDPASNLVGAFRQLLTVRLAIRTMEGLIRFRAMGHPLVILSAAVLYGLEKAMEDMASLFTNGSTPLSKYADIEVPYADYLRLFLLLQVNEAEKLARIAALIEFGTGYGLQSVPAAVSGEVRASVRLWFLPGLMRSLGKAGILRGRVVGNRYETTRTAAASY
ncbi:MAG TPA: hypothetical protein VMS09_06060 [Paenibacillus sp.]|uniref:hypothetical protein n=1 Tax=Paenibacillus sp. TaxID=58172 RepID=UPI002B9462DF|nr:hypothetical protein [Paenibacillus sp.]HUC91584.1 hypothetical protein [Paenibacillus sp.]